MKQKITMKANKNLSIREAYELFERKARVRNLSEATLKTYGYHMESFCTFTDGEQPVKNINEDIQDAIETLIDSLEGDVKERVSELIDRMEQNRLQDNTNIYRGGFRDGLRYAFEVVGRFPIGHIEK